MNRKELQTEVANFVPGKTIIDIGFTNREVESGVIFDGLTEKTTFGVVKVGVLHWKSKSGGRGGEVSHGLIAYVRESAKQY